MSEFAVHLTQAALDDVHASWVTDIDAALLAQAKASHYGRRWLASRLANLELFSVPPAALGVSTEILQAEMWWSMPISDNSAWWLELGAYTHISSIRLAIRREHVLQWRRVLGPALYQRLMREAGSSRPTDKEFRDDDDSSLKWKSLEWKSLKQMPLEWNDDTALVQMLKKCAYEEMIGFALRQHPLLAQRVALAFPEMWWQNYQRDPQVPLLDQATVTKILAS